MTDHDDDMQFDAFIHGDGELNQQYAELQRSIETSVPEAMENTILIAAAQAVATSTLSRENEKLPWRASLTSFWRLNWTMPTSMAAVLITVSLLMTQPDFQPPVSDSRPVEARPEVSAAQNADTAQEMKPLFIEQEKVKLLKEVKMERITIKPVSKVVSKDKSFTDHRNIKEDLYEIRGASRSKVMGSIVAPSIKAKVKAKKTMEVRPSYEERDLDEALAVPMSDELLDVRDDSLRLISETFSAVSAAVVSPVTPEKWLLEIQLLLDAGKRDLAEKQYNNFVKEYPDFESDELEKIKGQFTIDPHLLL